MYLNEAHIHVLVVKISLPLMSALPVDGTCTGVGVGVGVFVLLVLLTVVALILVVVVMRRKATYKQKGDAKMGVSLYYKDTVVQKKGIEMKERGLGTHYSDVDNCNEKGEEESSLADGFDLYENSDSKAQMKTANIPAPKESATPISATNVHAVYAVVDKNKLKKKGAKKETEDRCTVKTKVDLYAVPMKKMGKMTNKGEGVVESGGVQEEEQYDDTVGLRYEPKADKESGQQSEGDSKAPNADVLYAVVDKSRKKRK